MKLICFSFFFFYKIIQSFSLENSKLILQDKLTKPQDQLRVTNLVKNPSYFGWSSWSLQAYKGKGYGFNWLNETNVKHQVEILSNQFSQFGYDRVNLDSGWQDPKLDAYGRVKLDAKKFPSGIHNFQSYLTSKKFKLGLYYLPGIDSRAVENRSPIRNTQYTADEIIQCPKKKSKKTPEGDVSNSIECKPPTANAFASGHALNYSHPGSQMYINSIVDGLYEWNVSFVKLDGIVPGSSFDPSKGIKCNTRADLAAWRKAIEERYDQEWQYVGREKIWLVASWKIPLSEVSIVDQNANSWRIEQDVEAYGTVMTTFDRVIRNVKAAALWTSIDENRNFHGQMDLDSVLVSDMSYAESQSMVTFWAMLGSPIYSGDDLSKLPQPRKALLTNSEVLTLARIAATNPAKLDGFSIPETDENLFCQRLKEKIWTNPEEKTKDIPERSREIEEKVKMVVELSLFQNRTSSIPIFNHHNPLLSKCVNSIKRSVDSITSKDRQDIWALQFWVLDLDEYIYVAIVNAGKQVATDESVQVELNLSQLDLFQKKYEDQPELIENRYLVRDLWKKEDIGVVGFHNTIPFTLVAHGSKLFKFSLI